MTGANVIRDHVHRRIATRYEYRLLRRYERLGEPKTMDLALLGAAWAAASWRAWRRASDEYQRQFQAFRDALASQSPPSPHLNASDHPGPTA